MVTKEQYWITRPGYEVDDVRKREGTKLTKQWCIKVKEANRIDERRYWGTEWWGAHELHLHKVESEK